MKSPCKKCELETEDKNNPTCETCKDRIAYAKQASTPGSIIPFHDVPTLDIKKFKQVVVTCRLSKVTPAVSVRKEGIFINNEAVRRWKLEKYGWYAVYHLGTGKARKIAMKPLESKTTGSFRIGKSMTITNKPMMAELKIKPGYYQCTMEQGYLVFEVPAQ